MPHKPETSQERRLRRQRQHGCTGKQAYENAGLAERAMNSMIWVDKKEGNRQKTEGLSVYQCPWCQKFHIGHSSRTEASA